MQRPRTPLLTLLLSLTLVSVSGCGRDASNPTSSALRPDGELGDAAGGGPTLNAPAVVVPAGSVNALAAAIAAAGTGGRVILASGLHRESGTVLITQMVRIEGQAGAILESTTSPATTYPLHVDPALHFRGANRSVLRGVTIRTPGGATGGAGILIEDANRVTVDGTTIDGFQFGILVQRGPDSQLDGNTIRVSTAWQIGAIPESMGIVIINGARASVTKNVISGGLFGVWACDARGTASQNELFGNFIGIILCTVPTGNYEISGAYDGAQVSCTEWSVRNNTAHDNLTVGLLAIDNANNNRLINNAASGNGAYDMELAGDSYRFGFLTPKSFDNVVIAGSHPDIRIKDCGSNNTLMGFSNVVDNNLEPCN